MATSQEIDPTEPPLDLDVTQKLPPLSEIVDDDDNANDEHWDENEAPDVQLGDRTQTRGRASLEASYMYQLLARLYGALP
jgi:hypothetical protein